VPGDVRGFEYIHNRYGALPWSQVLQPAIDVARNGFSVSADLVRAMESASRKDGFLTKDPTWAIDFAPNGTRVGLGDIMTRKRYATTLEAIAKGGADAFYTGAMAEATVAAVAKTNGTMTMQDLEDYQVISRSIISINFHGYDIAGCGSPASGAVALSVLKTVEGYDGFGLARNVNISSHRLVEAMRFAYGKASDTQSSLAQGLTVLQRASLGDPDFINEMEAFEAGIINDTYAALIRAKISDLHTLNVSAYDPDGFESHDS